jgi:capsular exopolysaccharide synthesis family protein
VALDVKIRELEESYGPKWPALRAAVDQRGLLRSAMQREARQLLESKLAGLVTQLQDENDKLLKVVHTEEELAREIERAKSEEAALLKIRLDYGPLTVKRDEARVLFEEISQRYARTALVSQVETNNIRVEDLAVEPSSPMPGHQKVRLLLGILIGFAVGVGLAGFVEALDSTVKTREDVEEVSGLSFLGLVPLHDYAEDELLGDAEGPSHELLLFHRPRSTVAEHIRTVRTNIFFAAPGVRPRLVVVTSPGPREGKTTLAANLGAANAMAGARTLLMDLDMRRPRLHNVFNQAKQPGLTEAYEGALDLRSVIRPTAVAGLDFLPCGAVSANPVEILESQRFRDMIDELLGIYDTVVMDSPPLLSVADAVVQSSYAQVTVLVAKAGSTAKEALREARDMLAGVVDRKVGVILNCFDVERHAYRYSYYKSKRYGYYNYYTITEETAVEASGELPARTNNERSS